jgi:hypothetical protein
MRLSLSLAVTICGLLWQSAVRAQIQYEVLVNSRDTHAVFRYDLNGNWLGEFVTSGSGGLQFPEDILFHPDGTVLVTGAGNAQIKRYDGSTGDYFGNFSSGYSLSIPSKMSIGPDSLIYVTQWGTVQNNVVRFDLSGAFVDEFTTVGAPLGLGHFWDDQGRFYISLYDNGANGTVHRFAADGSNLGVFIDSSILQGPTDLWQDTNGDVLVQDWTSGTVLRYDANGQFISTYISGLSNPEGHAWLPNGNLLMGDWGEDAVHLFDPLGTDLGYFCNGNGLADPNCVRLRTVGTIGMDEISSGEATLQAVPTIGPGPFVLLGQLPGGATHLTVLDGTGRVVEDRTLTSTGTVAFNGSWEPAAHCAPGAYHVVISCGGTVLRAMVVLTDQ